MAAALQIWSHTFSKAFDGLPTAVREAVLGRIDEMGTRLENFSHQRLQGRSEFKLRVGDYRVLYEFDLRMGGFFCITLAIGVKSTSGFRFVSGHK